MNFHTFFTPPKVPKVWCVGAVDNTRNVYSFFSIYLYLGFAEEETAVTDSKTQNIYYYFSIN
jgi:hypothetical protein